MPASNKNDIQYVLVIHKVTDVHIQPEESFHTGSPSSLVVIHVVFISALP